MLGKPPKDNRERNFCKQSILAIVNGMGPEGLAKRLGCDKETARSYLDKFEQAYPNELAYRRLMAAQIRMTGKVSTFAGRERVDTAHHWLVTQPRIQIKVSYKRGDRYWLDVSPLEPKARVLTCYVHRAWDARPGRYMGQLIYTAPPLDACIQMQATGGANGCTTDRAYRLYDTTFLEYRLPLRNWGWRSIRRVRPSRGSPGWGEEAQYRGLDSVTRALFNAICQGGTADLTKIQLFSIGSLLTKFGAVTVTDSRRVGLRGARRSGDRIHRGRYAAIGGYCPRLRGADRLGAQVWVAVRGVGVARRQGDTVPAPDTASLPTVPGRTD